MARKLFAAHRMRMGLPLTLYRRCPLLSSVEFTQRSPTDAAEEYDSLPRCDCRLQVSALSTGSPICHGHHNTASASSSCGKLLGSKVALKGCCGNSVMVCETTTRRLSESASVHVRTASRGRDAVLVAMTVIVTATSQGAAGGGGRGERGRTVREGRDSEREECWSR